MTAAPATSGLVRAIQERDTQLRRSQTKLLQVLENLPIAVACVQLISTKDQGLQEELIFVNQQLQSTLGYQFQDLSSGKQWMEQAFPVASYRDEVNQRWKGALERARGEEGLDNPSWVRGDASQLQMAINNLIRNALEAMQSQGRSQAVDQLAVTLRQQGDQAVLTIADSGPGFPPGASELPLTSTKLEGSGLGLFVVRTTLEHHNGQLKIGRSRELGGAEVQLLLPMGR